MAFSSKYSICQRGVFRGGILWYPSWCPIFTEPDPSEMIVRKKGHPKGLSDIICPMTSFVTLEGLSICIVLPGCVRDCKNARPRVSCADNKFPSCPFQLCKWKERQKPGKRGMSSRSKLSVSRRSLSVHWLPSSRDCSQTPTVLPHFGYSLYTTDSDLWLILWRGARLLWGLRCSLGVRSLGTSRSHIFAFSILIRVFWSELKTGDRLLHFYYSICVRSPDVSLKSLKNCAGKTMESIQCSLPLCLMYCHKK